MCVGVCDFSHHKPAEWMRDYGGTVIMREALSDSDRLQKDNLERLEQDTSI